MQINKSSIFISYIERGIKFPSLNTLIDIANALDISLDMLVGNSVNSNLEANLCYINNKLIQLSPNRQQVLFRIMESMLDIELDNQKNSNIIES
jgi:transcriptional regulator with XRE-family HTH domain